MNNQKISPDDIEKMVNGMVSGVFDFIRAGAEAAAQCEVEVEDQDTTPPATDPFNGVGAVPQDLLPKQPKDLAPFIDHTLLKPDATPDQIETLCNEAKQHGFASVCVNPGHIEQCASLLKGTPVKVCTVVGFPLGATTPEAKAAETRDAIKKGAHEIDMVINIGQLKARNFQKVQHDIQTVKRTCGNKILKVILETGLLDDAEKRSACILCTAAGADFVKTSTGFSTGGATIEDINLMRELVGSDKGVKASGGIRDTQTAMAMINAGASRIGASAGIAIIQGKKSDADY